MSTTLHADGNSKAWGVYTGTHDGVLVVSIIPKNDLRAHLFSVGCRCAPRLIEEKNGSVIVVHNPWDGREFYEQ